MNHFGHTTITPNLSIRIFFNRGKEGGGGNVFPSPIRPDIQGSDVLKPRNLRHIFLELSVIVMKYSFKLNNSEPLSEKSPKQITANLS